MNISEVYHRLKKDPQDAWYYIQGNVRTRLLDSWFKWMLRKHVVEQYAWRINVAAVFCYDRGNCICCGCSTPELFFADKECAFNKYPHCHTKVGKQCYPRLMGRKEWNRFKQDNKINHADVTLH